MYKILKNIIEMDDYSVQKLGSGQSKKLPEGYQKVDYIESNGTQYIDTKVNADSNLRTVLDMEYTDITYANTTNVGAIYSGDEGSYVRYHLQTSVNKIRVGLLDKLISLIDTDTERHKYDIDVINNVAVVDGEKISLTNPGAFDTQLNFWLFGRNSNKQNLIFKSYLKLYSSKMYVSGALVRDLVPAIKKSNGNQLFDYTRTTGIIANKYINQAGAIVSGSNEYYISYPISVVVGETYTWRFNSDSYNTTHTAPTVGFYDINDNLLSTAQHASGIKYFSFTVPSNCAYIRCSVFTRDNAQQQAMLNKGSTPMRYETYIPDEVGMYDLSATSKNLYDGNLIGGVYNSSDFNINPNVSTSVFKSIKVYLPSGTYTFGFATPVNIVRKVVDGEYSQVTNVINTTSYTITLNSNGYAGISFRANASLTEPWDNSNIMLNEGSTALPYEPYQKRFYTNDGTGEFGYEYKGEKVEPTSVTRLKANVSNVNNALSTDEFEPMQLEKDTVDLDNISKVDKTEITDNINEEQIKSISEENRELE